MSRDPKEDYYLRPCYTLSINGVGASLDLLQKVESIEVEESCDGSDTVTINVTDDDYYFLNSSMFIEDTPINLVYGFFEDTYRRNFNGYVSAIDISFPEDGLPKLSIFCLDDSHVMNREKKSRSWSNTTRESVVREIVKEYGFTFIGDSNYMGVVEETLTQSKQTDIEFIESLSQDESTPFIAKLRGRVLEYRTKGILGEPVSTLGYRTGNYAVKSFSPKVNKETKKVKTTSSNIVSSTKINEDAVAEKTVAQGLPTKGTSFLFNTSTGRWDKVNPSNVLATKNNPKKGVS